MNGRQTHSSAPPSEGEQRLPSVETLRARFEGVAGFTVGLEEELMLLAPETFDLTPCARRVLGRLRGDARFHLELPTAQVEIATEPAADVAAAVSRLHAARIVLGDAAAPDALPAAAGVHPAAAAEGELDGSPAYELTRREYGPVATRQLVFALQVHVAVGGMERTLAVYNAARSYLPLIAALAANAPFYEGHDSGLASVRPKLCELLPRQGVPPLLGSVEVFADALRWGRESGFFPQAGSWWWEMRPHPVHGTLEFRVPDAQRTVREAGALAALVQALVAELAARHDAGEPLPVADTWRIEENRWSACRHGLLGEMADLGSGARRPTRSRLEELLQALEPRARDLGCSAELAHAARMVERGGGATLQRQVAEEGLRPLLAWLQEGFLQPPKG